MQNDKGTAPATEALIGWAAGLFEGEGSLFVTARSDARYKQVTAALVSTDHDVVQRFHDVVKVGRIYGPYSRGHKPFWRWGLSGRRDMVSLLDLIGPFLGERRAAKAAEVRGLMAQMRPQGLGHCFRGHPFDESNTRWNKNGKYMKRTCRACAKDRDLSRVRTPS
jgi:hypothetical protein